MSSASTPRTPRAPTSQYECLPIPDFNASSGLGDLMSDASLFGHTDVLILGLFLYAALGLLTDSGVRLLERRLLDWQPGR